MVFFMVGFCLCDEPVGIFWVFLDFGVGIFAGSFSAEDFVGQLLVLVFDGLNLGFLGSYFLHVEVEVVFSCVVDAFADLLQGDAFDILLDESGVEVGGFPVCLDLVGECASSPPCFFDGFFVGFRFHVDGIEPRGLFGFPLCGFGWCFGFLWAGLGCGLRGIGGFGLLVG